MISVRLLAVSISQTVLVAALIATWIWLALQRFRFRSLLHKFRTRIDELETANRTRISQLLDRSDDAATDGLAFLAGSFAHDLNNLLVGVMSNAESLKLSHDADRLNQGLNEIIECSETAAKLTKHMAAYTGARTAALRRLDLHRVVERVLPTLRARLRSNHELGLVDSPIDLWAMLDATQVEQVLMNLVVNAAEASPRGTAIDIRLGSMQIDDVASVPNTFGERTAGGSFVFVEVVDHGRGFDKATLQHMCEPFYSQKGSQRGLGLAIVLRCVTNHGGLLQCESEVGKGTCLRVLFPQIVSTAAEQDDSVALPDGSLSH